MDWQQPVRVELEVGQRLGSQSVLQVVVEGHTAGVLALRQAQEHGLGSKRDIGATEVQQQHRLELLQDEDSHKLPQYQLASIQADNADYSHSSLDFCALKQASPLNEASRM